MLNLLSRKMCVSVCVCGGGGGVHTRYVTGEPRGRDHMLYGLIVLAIQIFNVILVEKKLKNF